MTGIKDVTHLAASAYLVQNGVDIAKVHFIEMAMPEMPAAMKRGTIAAGIIAEPNLSGASGDVRTFAKASDAIARRMMISGWFGTADWYARNTALAKRFVGADGNREPDDARDLRGVAGLRDDRSDARDGRTAEIHGAARQSLRTDRRRLETREQAFAQRVAPIRAERDVVAVGANVCVARGIHAAWPAAGRGDVDGLEQQLP